MALQRAGIQAILSSDSELSPPNTPSPVKHLAPPRQPPHATPVKQHAGAGGSALLFTPTDLGSPATSGYYSEQGMGPKEEDRVVAVVKSMPNISTRAPAFTLTTYTNGTQTLEPFAEVTPASPLHSIRITTQAATCLFSGKADSILASNIAVSHQASSSSGTHHAQNEHAQVISLTSPARCDPARVAESLDLAPCAVPVYSTIMLTDRDVYFGLPVNTSADHGTWKSLYDPKLVNKSKIRSLSDDSKGSSRSVPHLEADRQVVRKAVMSFVRPLLVIKKGNKGNLVDGELYLNWELARLLFGGEYGKIRDLFGEIRRKNRESADSWWHTLSPQALSADLGAVGWVVPHGQPPKVRELALDIDYLLGLDGIGGVLLEVIEDGVSLIRDLGYKVDELGPEQLRIRAGPLFEHVAEAMVEAGSWTAYTVEQARRPLLKGASWRVGAPLYESASGKMKPLSQQFIDKVRECASGAHGAVIAAATRITKPTVENQHHRLAVSWGIHDRGANPINKNVEGFIEFYRTLRNHVRRAAPGAVDYALPPVTEESADFLSVRWNSLIGEGAERIKDVGAHLMSMVDPLDSEYLKCLSPFRDSIHGLVPDLVTRLDQACKDFDPATTGKTNAARLRIYPASQPGAWQSRFFLFQKDGASWKGRIARTAAEITQAESTQAQLQNDLDAAEETPEKTYQRCRAEMLNTPVPLKAMFEGTLKQLKAEISGASFDKFVQPALKAIEEAYFGLGVIRVGRPDPLPTYDMVSSLIARILMRINHHFKSIKTRQVRLDLLLLLFDVICFNMALPTPGLAGIFAQAEIRRICSYAFHHCPVPLSASVLSRIHTDMVGIETALFLLSSEHVRDGIVKAAWASMLPSDEAPNSHPLYFMRLLEIQHLLCGHPSCEEALIYDPRQLVKKGGKHIKRPRTLVSVQQTVVRGNINLGDGAPDFPAFPCLWICSVFPFDRSTTTAVSPYIQLIHTDDRKLTGKPHDSSLQGELNKDFYLSMEHLAIAEQLDGDQQYDGDISQWKEDDTQVEVASTLILDEVGQEIPPPLTRRKRIWRIESPPESPDQTMGAAMKNKRGRQLSSIQQ